jgi:signal transduction histidine kinase
MKGGGQVRARMSRLRWVTTDPAEADKSTGPDNDKKLATHRPDLWQLGSRLADAHPVVADTSVALAVAIVSAAWFVDQAGSRPLGWAVQVALILPLVWRRRYPVAVFSIISLVALVQWAIGVEMVGDLALLVSLYTLASHRPRVVATAGAALVEVGAIMASFRWSLAGSWPRSLVFLSGLVAAAFLLGTNLRSRRSRLAAVTERAERLEREREQQALIAATAERTRIAREMHDVIAHSLAVMISLADGASAKLRSDPERAGTAIEDLSRIGRQALGDTRRLLGVLRDDGASEVLAPQPGLAQIDGLLAQVRTTGLAASLAVNGEPRPLPPGAELSVYRIVQEATTNTLKHAVGATSVAVTLKYSPKLLAISVQDNGRALSRGTDSRPLRGTGHGLSGMRERAAIYGGTVVAGPSLAGWLVEARIPIAPLPRPRRSRIAESRATVRPETMSPESLRTQDERPLSRPSAAAPLARSSGPSV